MGQGYSMTTLSAASASIDVPELADIVHEKTLGSARFMKSIRARSQQGLVFVKAVMKPYSSFDVQEYVRQITEERNALADVPNALGYQRLVEVGSGGFLVRQYIFSSVYDRMSTRPFLEDIEKKWLAFQLLCAVRDCHARNIYHGDIKTENLLVTSWNWLYLTDFSSSFKPTNLPEDNPADFSFYFDTSGRRTCYLAPERFTTTDLGDLQGELNWAMDIFSVGCAIAEIFLEGPIFSLSQIFKYRAGEYSPEHTHLVKIEDPEVRAMILNMIELDPEKRYSAEQHLSFYRSKIFPEYFYSFLHQYMMDLTHAANATRPVGLDAAALGESDDKIDRVYFDFDKISFFLGYGPSPAKPSSRSPLALRASNRVKSPDVDPSLYDGSLLFLTLVVSSMRNTAKASARLKACDLLVAFAERLPDEAKLDRILPYVMTMLSDSSDVVKTAAIYALTALFDMAEVVSPINAYIFPEYIFPALAQYVLGPKVQSSILVRSAYASCLASLALSSSRVLDMVHAIRADGRLPALREDEWAPESSYHGLYDYARAELVPHFEEATVALITDPQPAVRRALLGSISRLCVFFGSAKASDVILTHLNTYMNDKDWMLRCSFFESLVGVASYIGSSSLEKYVLPIMVGSLVDPENFVVEKVFRSLARMAALGLLQKSTTWELVSIAARYLVHPSMWVRESAIQFIVLSSQYVSMADQQCIILPLIQPFLKSRIMTLTEDKILDNLKKPLTKLVFDSAVNWASKKGTSLFWTAASRDGAFILSEPETPQNPSVLTKRLTARIQASQKDKDDQTALEHLRGLGMQPDDEIKLLALREYILKVSKQRPVDDFEERARMLNDIMTLNQINVIPQNVLFDQSENLRESRMSPRIPDSRTRKDVRHSLTDALLDASTTIDGVGFGVRSPSARESGAATPQPIRGSNPPSRVNTTTDGVPTLNVETASGPRSSISNGGGPSSAGSERLSLRRNSPAELRHRNSAINLMGRVNSAKAEAEISSTPEIAFGRLDGPLNRRGTSGPSSLAVTVTMADQSRSTSPRSRSQGTRTPSYLPNHSYTGNDANVLRLLDNHFIENFPVDLHDFGQPRPPADSRTPIRRALDVIPQTAGRVALQEPVFQRDPWRPTGQLVAQFSEHSAGINCVRAAPDHAFFVTASDDGTCKVWDAIRLEKNVTPRSRYTHRHVDGARVKSLCFVEGTHTFVSGADDGSIHAVKIEYKAVEGGESSRYGRPHLVRDYQIPQATNTPSTPSTRRGGNHHSSSEYAVWLHHYRTSNSQSLLLAATNKCRILFIDMKTMDIIHTMSNPLHHGALTTFIVDRKQHWLLVGTSRGCLDLWDLRFKLRLRGFQIPTKERIERILIHPSKGHGRWVMASAGGEISVWDVEKLVCREVLRPSSFVSEESKAYEAILLDDKSNESLLSLADPGSSPSDSLQPRPSTPGLYILHDHIASSSSSSSEPQKYPLLLTGSSDRALRYWDLPHAERSYIISGPQLHSEDVVKEGAKHPERYEVTYPTSLSIGGQIALVCETFVDPSAPDKGGPKKATRPGASGKAEKGGFGSPRSTKSGGSTAVAPGVVVKDKPTRNRIISESQAQLLRTHMDGITDVCVLRKPYGCVVSVDRGGSVFIFS